MTQPGEVPLRGRLSDLVEPDYGAVMYHVLHTVHVEEGMRKWEYDEGMGEVEVDFKVSLTVSFPSAILLRLRRKIPMCIQPRTLAASPPSPPSKSVATLPPYQRHPCLGERPLPAIPSFGWIDAVAA